MSDPDYAGRINKNDFIISTSVLFGAAFCSLCARIYIRVRIQRQFGLDDFFSVLGFLMLTCAMGMLYYYVEEMYVAEAILVREGDFSLSYAAIEESLDYNKWSTVSLILLWLAITSVKLSFLALFRKLVDRIPAMTKYLWFVVAYVVVVAGYGTSVYVQVCPWYYSLQALTCLSGAHEEHTTRISASQQALDVFGDMLILVIPISLIWRIQIKWTQKLALSLSLCLTIVLIAVTLIRASGLAAVVNGSIDAVWESYWQYISAEVGLILSTATAFRAFFVSRNIRVKKDGRFHVSWYTTTMRRLRSFVPSNWRSTGSGSGPQQWSQSEDSPGPDWESSEALPQIPRPTMTGVRTFIRGQGKTRLAPSQIMVSQTLEIDEEWPLTNKANPGAKMG